MKSGMWNNFILRFGLLRIIGILFLFVLVGGGIAYAAGALPVTHTLNGTGTITVITPTPTNPAPVNTPAVYDFTPSVVALDFSGSVNNNNVYTVTKSITITNNGTNGANPTVVSTINSVSVSATGLPTGWSISGSTGSIAVGTSSPLDITLTSPTLTGTVVLPNFTITLTAS